MTATDYICPSCRFRTREGRCRNRRCPAYAPCDPAVRDQALRSMRADIARARRKVPTR